MGSFKICDSPFNLPANFSVETTVYLYFKDLPMKRPEDKYGNILTTDILKSIIAKLAPCHSWDNL
jgi:hypothetical protein